MPIYEFQCLECGNSFEELCKLGAHSAQCPKCLAQNVKKKVSSFSAQSSGSDGHKSIGGGHSCGSCHGGNCGTCH